MGLRGVSCNHNYTISSVESLSSHEGERIFVRYGYNSYQHFILTDLVGLLGALRLVARIGHMLDQ
jgi:hypothetical protein